MAPIPRVMREYAEETGVYGLNIFRGRTISRIEAVFWFSCVAFFGCLTVRDLSNLCTRFLREDVVTVATKFNPNVLVFEPAPTTAVRHGIETFKPNVDNLTDSNLEKSIDKILLELANLSISSGKTMLEIDENIFQLTSIMLYALLDAEDEIQHRRNPADLHYDGMPEEIRLVVAKAYQYYRSKKCNFSHLMRVIAAQICKKFDFSAYFWNSTQIWEEFDTCLPVNIVSMDPRFIVFRVMNRSVVFSEFYNNLDITWSSKTLFAHKYQYHAIYFDLTGAPMTNMESETTDSIYPLNLIYNKPEHIHVSVEVSAAYQMLPQRKRQPCADRAAHDPSRDDCKQTCRREVFLDACSCAPVYYSAAIKHQNKFDNCPYHNGTSEDLADYMSHCKKTNKTEHVDFLDACFARCLPNCHTKTFVTTMDRIDLKVDQLELRLSVRSFVYPLFEEKFEIGWDQFYAEFGGILGLYLGISFAGVVHIPIFALRKSVQRVSRVVRKKTSESTTDITLDSESTVSNVDEPESASSLKIMSGRIDDLQRDLQNALSQITKRLVGVEEKLKCSDALTEFAYLDRTITHELKDERLAPD